MTRIRKKPAIPPPPPVYDWPPANNANANGTGFAFAMYQGPHWKAVLDFVRHNDICEKKSGGVDHKWMTNKGGPIDTCNMILLRYKYAYPAPKTRHGKPQGPKQLEIGGYVLATIEEKMAGVLGSDMYIDVICSKSGFQGKQLLQKAIQLARAWKLRTVSLSALPHVIGYYPRFGFRSGPADPCSPEWARGRSGGKDSGYMFRKCLENGGKNYYNNRGNVPNNALLPGNVSDNNDNNKRSSSARRGAGHSLLGRIRNLLSGQLIRSPLPRAENIGIGLRRVR